MRKNIILTLTAIALVLACSFALAGCKITVERDISGIKDSSSAIQTESGSGSAEATSGEQFDDGREYLFEGFLWDGFTAQAKYVCVDDYTAVKYFDAQITVETTILPTCTTTGTKTYTATYGGYSDIRTEQLSAVEHNYVFEKFVWDGFNAQAKLVCANDGAHVIYRGAAVTSKITKQPTCSETGERVYTATYEEYSDFKSETIAKIEHNYQFAGFVWSGYTAQAKYVCANSADHVEYYTANVTSEITVQPTCTTTGTKTYTATYGGYSDSKSETLNATGHNYVDGVCTVCGDRSGESNQGEEKAFKRVDEDGNESETGNYILFGEYPQTIKAEGVTVTNTTDSRGYYLGSDGAYYAKITANPYASFTFSNGATIASGEVYYFKVEPIKWRILEEADGKAIILCEMIIDAHRFDDDSNNYKNSEIRAWLNDEFYNSAFSELQKGLINSYTVDNSERSTNPDNNAKYWNRGANRFYCDDTTDKVWLLSVQEVTRGAYGFNTNVGNSVAARQKKMSDFARADGAVILTSTDYLGNCWWWLRSPYYDNSNNAYNVRYDGPASSYALVSTSSYGVVPALQIDLSGEGEDDFIGDSLLSLTQIFYRVQNDTPYLVLKGTFNTAASAYLYLYEGNNKVAIVGDTVIGAKDEQFELLFDMRKLVEAGYLGKLMDIKFYAQKGDRIEDTEINLAEYGEGFVDTNQKLVMGGHLYYFEIYANTLKAVYADYKYEYDMIAATTEDGATLTIAGKVFDAAFFGKAVAINFWPGGEGTAVTAPIDAQGNFSATVDLLAFALNTTNYAHFKIVESTEDATELYRDGNDGNLANAKWVTEQQVGTYNIDLIENAQAIRFEYNGGEKVYYVGCGKWGGVVLYGRDERVSGETMSLAEEDGTVYLVYSGYIRGYDSAEAVVEFYTEQFAYVDIINDTNWSMLVLTAHDEEASKVYITATYVEGKGAYLFTVKIPVINAEAGMYYFFHAPDFSSNLQIKGTLNTTAVTATKGGVTLKYQLEKRTNVDDWKKHLVWVKVTEA